VRDTLGLGADIVSNPRRYYLQTGSDVSLVAVELISRRASLLDVEGIIHGDRYLFIRDLYLQRRAYAVLDGKVESDPFLDDSSDEEDTSAEAPSTPDPALESTPPADAEPGNTAH
jgi:phospholipid-binding lipoprotein MlaA